MFLINLVLIFLIQNSESASTTRRVPPTIAKHSTTTARYNPCRSPVNLYINYTIAPKGLNRYIVKGTFDRRPKNPYVNMCNLTLYNVPDMVYKFRLVRKMYFEIKMTGPNGRTDMDNILTIANSTCKEEIFCGDNEYVKTARLSGQLPPGQYILIASIPSEKYIDPFELEISFNMSEIEPSPYLGSCQKPINLTESIPITGAMGKIEGYLSQYYNKNTFSCSLYNTSSVVYSFTIPNSITMLGVITMQGIEDGLNKMDTLLVLADSDCEEIMDECDDDNRMLGGLSSLLNVTLESGEYRVLASGYDESVFGSFVLRYFFYPINRFGQLGSCYNPFVNDSLFAQNSTNYEIVGSFIEHEYEVACSCSNGNSSTYYYIVMSLNVPEGKQTYGSIELSGLDDNKMDTFVELKDKFCQSLHIKESCNDDSPKIGGLSSQIEGLIPSGDYMLVIGFLGKKEPDLFKLKINTLVFDL